jgi:hypothetical protein
MVPHSYVYHFYECASVCAKIIYFQFVLGTDFNAKEQKGTDV